MKIVVIGPECFTTGDALVISYKGSNYYKACGVTVHTIPRGGTTSCVKRTNHPGKQHEDYYGNTIDDSAPVETSVAQPSGA